MALGNFAFADEAQLISATTKDYEGHWAQATIQKWIDEGRASGYPDGSYKPDNNVTRAEFVKMVNGIIDFEGKGKASYTDVPAAEWYYDYIGIAQEIGYISGYPGGQFGPNDYITREQAASILARIQYLDSSAAGVDKFSDKSSISSWAAEAVGAASEAGFISGYNDGSFRPSKNLTRAEAVTMLENVMNNAKNHVIYNAGTKIENFVFDGGLVIAETVGEGDVTLNNVTVNGVLKVLGGGENSLYFNNVKVDRVVVSKEGVRLVLGQGTEIQEVELTSETILENTDGSIAKIVVNGDGTVTLKGKFDEVEVNAEADIVLNNAAVTKLVAEKPIVIKGTGTITTLEANADNIKFESKVDVKKTVVGEGVKTPPAKQEDKSSSGGPSGDNVGPSSDYVVQITLKSPDDTSAKVFNTDEYSSSSILSDFIAVEVGKILAKNSSDMDKYIAGFNSRLSGIEIEETKLYSVEGWSKAISYLNGTDIKTQVEGMKNALLLDGSISKTDLQSILNLYSSLKLNDIGIIKGNLSDIDSKDLTYNDEEISYYVTFEKGTAPVGNKAIADFILGQFKTSTVKNFFDTYGKVTFKATYGNKTAEITINSAEL
jgi:hypothetical protein